MLEEGTLEEFVQKGEPLPERGVRIVAKRLLKALAAMAAEGVSHGDVKPSNVGLAKKGKLGSCTLFDMGSWRPAGELSAAVAPGCFYVLMCSPWT